MELFNLGVFIAGKSRLEGIQGVMSLHQDWMVVSYEGNGTKMVPECPTLRVCEMEQLKIALPLDRTLQ